MTDSETRVAPLERPTRYAKRLLREGRVHVGGV